MEPPDEHAKGQTAAPFRWNRDAFFAKLQADFAKAKASGRAETRLLVARELEAARADLAEMIAIARGNRIDHDRLADLREKLFELAPAVVAFPDDASSYLALAEEIRAAARVFANVEDRHALYTTLYGLRVAVEEVLLAMTEAGAKTFEVWTHDVRSKSTTSDVPSAIVNGVYVQSGDMLLSRGGAPTSALIARGSDFPGNFSHVALVHIDAQSREVSIIEAHIERGIAVSTAAEYLGDGKLRILALRLRDDHPALIDDPMLPHAVAMAALKEARERHVAYDFGMKFEDPEKKFCSEVVWAPYKEKGVDLWQVRSTMSGAGVVSWLGSLGVGSFETLAPADLEYDLQLVAFAEWRTQRSLRHDHIDNAVIDGLLVQAERGLALAAPWWKWPLAALAKAYSWVLNRFGKVGPVPEGMSAVVALRVSDLMARFAASKTNLVLTVEAFEGQQKRFPAVWELVEMAKGGGKDSA